MPEFHKNQVAWSAPEAQTVSLAKPDYAYLADALNSLAKDSQNIADTEAKMLDDKLLADLNEQVNLANQDIEDARSATGDFDYLGERSMSRLQSAFSKYDEATRKRFLRSNPHYMDNFQLAVSEKINNKKRAVIENGVKNELPQWASTAAMIGTEQARKDMILKIQDRLGNISDETTLNNMIFAANQMFDKYNVSALLFQGTEESLNKLESLLKNNKELTTLTPEERIDAMKDVRSAREDLEKRKKLTTKDPQAKAIVEAYAKLWQNGFKDDALRIYNEVLNTQNTLITTSANGLEYEINGEVLPLYLALDGLNATDRAAIAKEMETYDKMDSGFLFSLNQYGNDVDDLLRKFNEGYQNKTSDQSLALAGLEDAMSTYRFFKELPSDKQKEIERIVRQSGKAKDEIMDNNSMPYRATGVFFNNGAQRVYSGDIAAEYLLEATGRPYSPVPLDMRTQNETTKMAEDLFQMSFVNPQKMTQAERDIYDRHSVANKIANSIIYGETRGGDALIDYMQPLRTQFYRDIEDNTNGEFVLLVWGALDLLQRKGALKDTRFDSKPSTYRKMADSMIANLKSKNLLNARTTDEIAKATIDMLRGLTGNGQLTEYEQAVLKTISDGASSAQINRDSDNFVNFYDKHMSRVAGGRDIRSVVIPSDAKPSPTLRNMAIAIESMSQTEKDKKATKAADAKIRG